jgi:sec-independent protein translocase protein TatA
MNPIHLAFIAMIALIFLGPKRLPELAKTLGTGMREFRETMNLDGSHEPTVAFPAAAHTPVAAAVATPTAPIPAIAERTVAPLPSLVPLTAVRSAAPVPPLAPPVSILRPAADITPPRAPEAA